MKRSIRIIAGITAVIAVLFVVAIVLAVILFPKDKVIALAEKQAAEALGMPVHVGDAGISFAGIPAISVRDITVGPPPWTSEPLATIEAVRVRVNIMKLLSRQIEITSVDIDTPRISFTPPPADTTVTASLADTTATQPGAPSLPVPVTMQSLRIMNGSAVLHMADGSSVELTDIDQRLSLTIDRALTGLVSTGTLTVGDIVFSSPILPEPLEGIALSFSHNITGSIPDGSFTLNEGELSVNDLGMDVTGSMTGWTDIAFALTTGDLTAADILELVPGSLLPVRDRIDASGTFSLSLNGSLKQASPDNELHFSGILDIPGMRLAYEGAPAAIDNLAASIAIDENRIRIEQLSVAAGASGLTVGGTVDAYLSEPILDMSVTGDINMDDVIGAAPALADKNLEGRLGIDLTIFGGADSIAALKPSGTLDLDGFAFTLPEVLNHPAAVTGSVGINPKTVTLEGISVLSGESDFRLDGALTGYLNLLSSDPDAAATLTATLSSNLIDIADLLVIDREKETKIIMPWDLKEPVQAMPLPPNLTANAAIRLGTIQFGNLTAESATGDVTVGEGRLDFSGLSVHAYNGTLTGGMSADFIDIENPSYETSLALNGFESGTFLADLFGTDQFMRGTLSSTIALAGAGFDSVAVLENLNGHGTMSFANGEIDNLAFIRRLGEHLPFLGFDAIAFDTITNSYRIEDQQFITPDMHLGFAHGDIYLDGATGFDKTIDYHLRLVLDREASQGAAKYLSSLAGLLDTGIDSIELDVAAGGTLDAPAFRLDTSRAEQQLKDAAKNKLQDKAEEFIEDKLKDSELQEQGRELLNRLFR